MIPMSYYSPNLLDENGFFSPCRFVEAYIKEITKGLSEKNSPSLVQHQVKQAFSIASCIPNETGIEDTLTKRFFKNGKVMVNRSSFGRNYKQGAYDLPPPPPPPPFLSSDANTMTSSFNKKNSLPRFYLNETSSKETSSLVEDSLMDFEEISEESDTTFESSESRGSTSTRVEPVLTNPWEKSTEVPNSLNEAKPSVTANSSQIKHEKSAMCETLAPVKHKLKLVLDLDNTLLHACSLSKLCNIDIPLHDFQSPENDSELYTFRLSSFFNQLYHVKFRPGVRRFLKELSLYCDMGIHTNATHEYADVIVSILDPDYSLFQGRVASREDETTKDHKKNMGRLFRVDDLDIASLLILDDRKDVWDTMYHPNIIKCGVYDYLDARKNVLIEKYCHGDEKDSIPCNTTSVGLDSLEKKNYQHSQTNRLTTHASVLTKTQENDNEANCMETHLPIQESSKSCVQQTCASYNSLSFSPLQENDATVIDQSLKTKECQLSDESDVYFLATNNNEEETTSPFLDNPLLKKSQLTVPQNLDETDNYEDDDVITLDEKHIQSCGTSDSTGTIPKTENNDLSASRIMEISPFTPNETLFQPNSSKIAAHFGVSQDSVTENMRLAMKLSQVDQALIDYDTQLDELRHLIVSVALEYNRQKSNPLTCNTVSVPQILNHTRQSILQGVVAQTVGMYKSKTSHPEYGWQDNGPVHRRRLVKLGAQVVDSPVPDLTHIIAMRATQTIDRVRQERGQSVQYVHALWLHACESTWKRIPENWFPAFPLLEKYNNSPPMKPWLDHWQLIALQNETINDRLVNALKKQSIFSKENHTATFDMNAKSQIHSTPQRRQHLVLSNLSAGAEVWSANEHICLTYDNIESVRLKKRLNLPLTPEESETIMQVDKHPVTLKPVWSPFETKYFKKTFNTPRSKFRQPTNHRKWDKRKRNNASSRDYPHHYSMPRNLLSHNRCWFKDTYSTTAVTNSPEILPKRQLLSSDSQKKLFCK
ncbi:uncharacterized protein LOC128883384 isoform X2 [Hylaeus volcanicus]|uniref:uncharacterized protein LOC128883384 isoform X2 n=1 Tax=Hylaeus volcanicus TaxID=313075 RepID=UPI0023B881C4|nr:uncharacterized protein LOC128883384 isoform X2 [Hylaeus volcanicus]